MNPIRLPILITITARTYSKRLEKKALIEWDGKPFIAHLIERLQRSGIPVCLCTTYLESDFKLVDITEKCGAYVMKGEEYDPMGRIVSAIHQFNPIHIIRVTGDDLFIDLDVMIKQLKYHINTKADITTCLDLPKGFEVEIIRSEFLLELHQLLQIERRQHIHYVDLEENPLDTELMTQLYDKLDYKKENLALPKKYNFSLELNIPKELPVILEIYDKYYPKLNKDLIDDYLKEKKKTAKETINACCSA